MSDYLDYHRAVGKPEGSVVANHLLRELMEALGESTHARPQTPRGVWDEMLAKVRRLAGTEPNCRQCHAVHNKHNNCPYSLLCAVCGQEEV